jgi:hypothetical protein
MTEVRAQLIRRFASLAVPAEAMDTSVANGQAVDVAQYALISSTLVRIATRLGINCVRPKVEAPTLAEVEARYEEPAHRRSAMAPIMAPPPTR